MVNEYQGRQFFDHCDSTTGGLDDLVDQLSLPSPPCNYFACLPRIRTSAIPSRANPCYERFRSSRETAGARSCTPPSPSPSTCSPSIWVYRACATRNDDETTFISSMHSHESIITTERSIRDVTQTRPRPLRRLDPRASNQRIHQVNQIVPPSLTYVAGNHRTPWPPVSPGARTSPWPCRTRAPRTPRGRVRRRCSHHHRASSRARPPSRTPRTVAARSHA